MRERAGGTWPFIALSTSKYQPHYFVCSLQTTCGLVGALRQYVPSLTIEYLSYLNTFPSCLLSTDCTYNDLLHVIGPSPHLTQFRNPLPLFTLNAPLAQLYSWYATDGFFAPLRVVAKSDPGRVRSNATCPDLHQGAGPATDQATLISNFHHTSCFVICCDLLGHRIRMCSMYVPSSFSRLMYDKTLIVIVGHQEVRVYPHIDYPLSGSIALTSLWPLICQTSTLGGEQSLSLRLSFLKKGQRSVRTGAHEHIFSFTPQETALDAAVENNHVETALTLLFEEAILTNRVKRFLSSSRSLFYFILFCAACTHFDHSVIWGLGLGYTITTRHPTGWPNRRSCLWPVAT